MPDDRALTAPLTPEEHAARAMLLGLCYHHGNGDPVYYKVGAEGLPIVASMIDGNTLEPMLETGVDGPYVKPEYRYHVLLDPTPNRKRR